MAIVIVDGQQIELSEHERLNGIQAAERVGVNIPHYCWHAGLTVVASCRMCLVETGTRNAETGAITMVPKLMPACQTPAKDGTVFVTNSEAVKKARAQVEEALLIDHPIDCPICDKAGECHLQDYHFEHGQAERRADIRPFTSATRDMGDTVKLFVDRCVMCSRCVRFCREITGTSELLVINRGSAEEIDVFPGYPLANKLSGCVVDLCPVGALGDKDFLYKQRVWFMRRHLGVCAGCSTGCTIRIDENQDTVYRLTPQENPFINKWWMCDEGRYGYKHLHSPERKIEPRRHVADREFENVDWSQLPRELAAVLEKVCSGGRLAAVVSPHLTVEEAYLLCKLARSIDSQAVLALGPIVAVGEDESFPGKFTIHAEKCPNRKGVEEMLAHFCDGKIKSFDELLEDLSAQHPHPSPLPEGEMQIKAAWVSGGYSQGNWCDENAAAPFAALDLLVVQDMFESPLWKVATYQLPGAGFAERAGSYVNFAHRLQSFTWAIRPPAGVWVEGQLYWQMLGMRGLYNPRKVLGEVAAEMIAFSAAADEIPLVGIDLRVNQLAGATV
ncbi:MAG TPA: 2Fe-2S iron-sulfur cluster-binding protein [Pirellulales bacterium]|jgi:NADH-quinone oxidoreductase subunit G|nr:2Fe-2S iron-sulfur cluster-binding protein [Pirellulales bacterium]